MGKNEHSEFPPSAMHMYIACNGSWREAQNRPKQIAGPAAERGTLLHEYVVRAYSKGKAIVQELREKEDRYQVLACINYLEELALTLPGPYTIEFEQRVTLDKYGLPQVWGTSDVIMYDTKNLVLHVIDWKFGSSEVHYAKLNAQGMIYAAGAMAKYPKAYKVHIHFVQPSIGHADSVDYDREEIADYVEHTVKKAVVGCLSSNPEYNPTKKGCMYCVANIDCEANRRFNLQLAKKLFDDADTPAKIAKIAPEEIKYILDTEARLKLFMKNVRTYAKSLLQEGKEVPGYKLVNGKNIRSHIDPKETEKWITENTIYSSADCYKVEFKSPAQLEAMEGDWKNDDRFQKLIVKKPSAPIIVKESDSRPALLPVHKVLDIFDKYSDEDYEKQIAADMKGSKVRKPKPKPKGKTKTKKLISKK